jgi:hypothetical protein
MSDYSSLAQRVSMSVPGVRGCLLLSRDGLVLGAHPEGEEEAQVKDAWVRFAAIGEPDRSYLEYPDQVWAFVRRGGYAAFAVAEAGVRPGVLVDLLDQALMTGELERSRDRETLRLPEAPQAPSGKPRTNLHKADRVPEPEPVAVMAEPAAVEAEQAPVEAEQEALDEEPAATPDTPPEGVDVGQEASPEPQPSEEHVPPDAEDEGKDKRDGKKRGRAEGNEETEVDRILLAKEFAGLLQVPTEDDEGSR